MQINTLKKTSGTTFEISFVKRDTLTSFSEMEKKYVLRQIEKKNFLIPLLKQHGMSWLVVLNDTLDSNEEFRCMGAKLFQAIQTEKIKTMHIDGSPCTPEQIISALEGLSLESYQFLNYFKDDKKLEKTHGIESIQVYHPSLTEADIKELNHTLDAVFWARDLVNEPVNKLNALALAQEVQLKAKDTSLKVEVLDKNKISALRMGGLLSVNKGSIDPPTFTICEWKPEDAVNSKPYVLVGKGIMYDTGGLSLKPTQNSMDLMKSDMGGAATVAASLYALALNQIPVWVIGLLPATDNRPGLNAYTPGDIIKMYNGLHVEVLNTDAEGRLILADALSFGDQYEPELCCTVATLTGNAEMAIGSKASVFMGNAEEKFFKQFQDAAEKTHERLVQFPFWKEYGESIKSDVADLKNLGERAGGAISAGKFLEHFTSSPYIHFDIAGTAFLTSAEPYKPKGGTGVGVRLFVEFFKAIAAGDTLQ